MRRPLLHCPRLIFRLLSITVISVLLLNLIGCETLTERDALFMGQAAFDCQDYPAAYYYFYQAAKLSSPQADYALGFMNYFGLAVPPDEILARQYIEQAADAGVPEAVMAEYILAEPVPIPPALQDIGDWINDKS